TARPSSSANCTSSTSRATRSPRCSADWRCSFFFSPPHPLPLQVADPDGDRLVLTIQPPEYADIFAINEQNELELRFPASTLGKKLFSFVVVAADSGSPSLSAFANVKVRPSFFFFFFSLSL